MEAEADLPGLVRLELAEAEADVEPPVQPNENAPQVFVAEGLVDSVGVCESVGVGLCDCTAGWLEEAAAEGLLLTEAEGEGAPDSLAPLPNVGAAGKETVGVPLRAASMKFSQASAGSLPPKNLPVPESPLPSMLSRTPFVGSSRNIVTAVDSCGV